jgi:hypothetical protein
MKDKLVLASDIHMAGPDFPPSQKQRFMDFLEKFVQREAIYCKYKQVVTVYKQTVTMRNVLQSQIFFEYLPISSPFGCVCRDCCPVLFRGGVAFTE